MNATQVARLMEQVVRSPFNACDALSPRDWAILRYLGSAGRLARTVPNAANYSGVSVGATLASVEALKLLHLIETHGAHQEIHRLDVSTAGQEFLAADPVLSLSKALAILPIHSLELMSEMLEAAAMALRTSKL